MLGGRNIFSCKRELNSINPPLSILALMELGMGGSSSCMAGPFPGLPEDV